MTESRANLLDLRGVAVRVGGKVEQPLVTVEDAGEGVSRETVAQRMGGLAHIGDVGRAAFLEDADRLFLRSEAPLGADPLGGLASLRPITQETAHEIVLLPDLTALLLGWTKDGGLREEFREREFGRRDVFGALRDGPAIRRRAASPFFLA